MERYELRLRAERDLARVPQGVDEALVWAESEGVITLLASLWEVALEDVAPAPAFEPAWPAADD